MNSNSGNTNLSNTTLANATSKMTVIKNQALNYANNIPIQMKIATIVIFFSFAYIFTLINYILPLSIIFGIITFIVISFLLSKLLGMIFLVLYIVTIYNKSVERRTTVGEPISETDIVHNNVAPYKCIANQLVVTKDRLKQDLIGGYFTYNFWIYINGNNNALNNDDNWYSYRYKEWKNVFYRGTPMNPEGDLSSLVQYPGVWLTPILNNMVIVFQNASYVERFELTNIPFNTWTNVVIVVESKSVSIYMNGLLERTLNLSQSIKIMNGYNLYLTGDVLASEHKQSGFAGYLAELIFYAYALTPHDIQKSYNYYKKILDVYQRKQYIDNKINYSTPGLITNSDYLSKNDNKKHRKKY
jgi:hypothetical protein